MATSTDSKAPASSVATRPALALIEPGVWNDSLAEALESVRLEPVFCTQLNEVFEESREHPTRLLVIAQQNPAFAVRACRVNRGLQDVPMIVVMPREADLIPALDAGADDAVVARVDPPVFAARIRALLRRAQPASRSSGKLVIRDLEIDMEKYQVTLQGRSVPLTPTEFRMLTVLAQQAGRVVDPRALLSAVHQHDYSERDAQNLVKVHIANLRRKLNDTKTAGAYILCVRGFGYMLERRSQTRSDDPLAELIES